MTNKYENKLLDEVYKEFGDQICLYSFLGAFFDGKSLLPCTEIIDDNKEWEVESSIKDTFRNNKNWVGLRKHFLKSTCHDNELCKVCSINEKNNFNSSRQAGNKVLTEISGPELLNTLKEVIENDCKAEEILYLHWFPSNYCNYECIMCSAAASSTRANFESKYNLNTHIVPMRSQFSKKKNEVLEIISKTNGVGLTGGETVLQPEVHKALDYLIEIGRADKVRLNLLTNASSFPDHMMEKFRKFKEVIFSVSVDGTGDIIEYQRRGSVWHTVSQNTIKIRDNFPMVINYVLTAVSVFSVVSFLHWAREHKFHYITFFPVKEPGEHLSLNVIPNDMKQNLLKVFYSEKENSESDIYKDLLNDVISFLEQSNFDNNLHAKFKKIILIEDKESNKSLVEVIPEWRTYFET